MKKFGIIFIIMILFIVQITSPIYASKIEDKPLEKEEQIDNKTEEDSPEDVELPDEQIEEQKPKEESEKNDETVETEDLPQEPEIPYEEIHKELEEKYNLLKEENLRLRKEILKLHNKLSKKPANKIPVLMYHHLLKQEDIDKYGWDKNNSVLSVEAFEKQMDYLYKNGFYTATLDELQNFIDGKIILPEKTVVITFDDGYYSNAVYAYPIMKKYNFRGTIFVIGNSFEKPQKDFNPKDKKLQHISLDESYKYVDVFDYESHSYNLHKVNENNIPLIISLDKDTIMEDLQKNKELVDGKYFAYPYGRYNKNAIEFLKDTGHEMAFTTRAGYVTKGMDKFQLPRFGISPKIKIEKFINIVNKK